VTKVDSWGSLYKIPQSIILLFVLTTSSLIFAQESGQKSVFQQLEEEEQTAKRKESFQGTPQSAAESLKRARESAKPEVNQGCPAGFTQRKIEDVLEFMKREEMIQKKIAEAIERFTNGVTEKKAAIEEFNQLARENNGNSDWARGRVTYGVCGRPSQTEILGTAVKTTELLFADLRRLLN